MLKRIILFKIVAIVICFCVCTSCKKGFLDVNLNPTDLTEDKVTPDIILPAVLESCVSTGNTICLQEWMGYWCFWQTPQSSPLVNYFRNSAVFTLGGVSIIPKQEIFFLESKSLATNQLFYAGIAKTIKALQWCQSVDIINNMPYRDAYNISILQPRYDDGKFIYEDAIVQLDTAIQLIKNATDLQSLNIGISDIMFKGDKIKWVKFINTLKLRLLIHQANRADRQTYIAAQIQKIIDEGTGFLGSGENANVNPGYIDNRKLSAYFGNFSSHNFLYGGGIAFDGGSSFLSGIISYQLAHANFFSTELLKKNKDPRLGFIYSTTDNPFVLGSPEPYMQSEPLDYRGNKAGFYVDNLSYPFNDALNVSAVGGSRNIALVDATSSGIIKGRNMSDWVMTSIESMFLQAEAIHRGWIAGDAETAYKNAVKESFRWLNVGGNSDDPSLSDAVFETWYNAQTLLNNEETSWAAAPDKYKLIMLQKYIGFNGIEPLETWTDYRRNGRFPNIPVSLNSNRAGNTIPIRMLYSPEEYLQNSVNVNAQGNIDIFTSKIWWMP